MRWADNQCGHTIERHDGQLGWVSILKTPFANRDMAAVYMDGMPREAGKEYRHYVALREAACG